MVSAQPPAPGSVPDLHMAGVSFSQIHLLPPFRARAPLADDWRLYHVGGGDVMFEADDIGRMRQLLPAGSVVALSGVLRHTFGSIGASARIETNWVEGAPAPAPAGVVITKGSIAQSRLAFAALFDRVVVFSACEHAALVARFARAIDWIVEEAARPGPESAEITRRLAEIITLEIGRFAHAAENDRDRSTTRAAADHRILRAISAFYAAPQEKWSVERLAGIAGMSRTAFAIRYRQLIGTTPLRSLRQLRLQLAADQISAGARSGVTAVAARAGYGSGTSFIRAFAHEFGTTPGRARRSGRLG